MFEYIQKLRPYFFSMREFETTISLDLKIPSNWFYETIIEKYNVWAKKQDSKGDIILISFITESTKEGYDKLFDCINELIYLNKEEEEKAKLFEEKLFELQELFQNSSLNELKQLILTKPDGQKDKTRFGLVEEGAGKRQQRNRKQQEKADITDNTVE